MTKKQIEERSRIIEAISQEANVSISEAEKIAKYLHRCNTTLNRYAELMCDGDFYNRNTNENEEFEAQVKLENHVKKYVAEKIGCKMHTQRDPRGHAVRLELKTYSNCWDRTTAPAW